METWKEQKFILPASLCGKVVSMTRAASRASGKCFMKQDTCVQSECMSTVSGKGSGSSRLKMIRLSKPAITQRENQTGHGAGFILRASFGGKRRMTTEEKTGT